MSATILEFPASSAQVIPIAAGKTKATDSHLLALGTMKTLFHAARAGNQLATLQLEIIAESHGEPLVSRLAVTLLQNLREPVFPPSDVEQPGEMA